MKGAAQQPRGTVPQSPLSDPGRVEPLNHRGSGAPASTDSAHTACKHSLTAGVYSNLPCELAARHAGDHRAHCRYTGLDVVWGARGWRRVQRKRRVRWLSRATPDCAPLPGQAALFDVTPNERRENTRAVLGRLMLAARPSGVRP